MWKLFLYVYIMRIICFPNLFAFCVARKYLINLEILICRLDMVINKGFIDTGNMGKKLALYLVWLIIVVRISLIPESWAGTQNCTFLIYRICLHWGCMQWTEGWPRRRHSKHIPRRSHNDAWSRAHVSFFFAFFLLAIVLR